MSASYVCLLHVFKLLIWLLRIALDPACHLMFLSWYSPAVPVELNSSTVEGVLWYLLEGNHTSYFQANPACSGAPLEISSSTLARVSCSCSPKTVPDPTLSFYLFLSGYHGTLYIVILLLYSYINLPLQLHPSRFFSLPPHHISCIPVVLGFPFWIRQFTFLHTVVVPIDLLWYLFLCALLNSFPRQMGTAFSLSEVQLLFTHITIFFLISCTVKIFYF